MMIGLQNIGGVLILVVVHLGFDFARIVATVTTVEILPMETIIRSITVILSQDVNEHSNDRYTLFTILLLV